MESKAILSRVALKCGDEQFQDFNQSIYEEALKAANRVIAKKYGIPNKVINFKTSDMIEDVNDVIYLELDDFKAEYHVKVNEHRVYKQDIEKEYNSYKLELLQDRYVFDYRYFVDADNGFVKSLDDNIEIYYTALPEYDAPLSDYFIPQKYIEEQIDETALIICKYGLAKFTDELKVGKYTRLFQMLRKNDSYDPRVVEHKEWIRFKPWSPI